MLKVRMMKLLDRRIKEAKASLEVVYRISNKYDYKNDIHVSHRRKAIISNLMRATALENKIDRLKVLYGIIKRFGM